MIWRIWGQLRKIRESEEGATRKDLECNVCSLYSTWRQLLLGVCEQNIMIELESSCRSLSEESHLEGNVRVPHCLTCYRFLHFCFEVGNLPDCFLPIVMVTLGIFMCQTLGLNIFKQCFNKRNLSFIKFKLIN